MAKGQADGQVVFEVVADDKKITESLNSITKTIETEGKQWDSSTKGSTDNMAGNFESMSGKATKAITDLTGKIISLAAKGINKMMDYSDAVDKGSKSIGISAKAYQELDYAMSMSGANIDTLTRGVGALNNALSGGGSKEVKDALSNLGISDDDLKSMSSMEELLDTVMYQLAGIDDQAQRADIANAIFGVGAGSQLAAFFAEGEDGIRKLRKEAEELGIVQSDEAIAQAVKTKDSIDTLNKTLDAVLMQAITPLLPLIQSLVEFITPFVPLVTDIFNVLTDLLTPILKLAGIDPNKTWAEGKAAEGAKNDAKLAPQGDELYSVIYNMLEKGTKDELNAVVKFLQENYTVGEKAKGQRSEKDTIQSIVETIYTEKFGHTVSGRNMELDQSIIDRTKANLTDFSSKAVSSSSAVAGLGNAANNAAKAINSIPSFGQEGSQANGLDYVSHDGYYMLHQGERVQTAAEADLSRRYGNQAPGVDYGAVGGAIRAGMGNMQIIWHGRVVADVLSEQQGDSYRALERSGWQS